MSKLSCLMDEIGAGKEVYYSGKSGGQYLKIACIRPRRHERPEPALQTIF